MEKYSIENIFAIYLGTTDEIQEIAICKKETDENGKTYYLDLLTNNKYTTTPSKTEVYAIKEHTLLSLIAHSNLKQSIIENGTLTTMNLLSLYNALNEDYEYKCYDIKYKNEKYGCPRYLERTHHDKDKHVIDGCDPTWINTRIAIETSNKVIVISGDKGIGKTTLIPRIFFIDPNTDTTINENNKESYWRYTGPLKIDYNKFKKATSTTKHLQNRIKKVINYMLMHADEDFHNAFLIIDNVDFSTPTFAQLINKEIQGTNIKVILISDRKIEDDFLNRDDFNIVQATKPNPTTIKCILSYYIGGTHRYSKDGENEIIEILSNCDNPYCMNKSHYDNNPKLGVTIISNAISIARANQKRHITIDELIEGMKLENINMSQTAKKKTEEELEKLKQKIEDEKQDKPKQRIKLFGKK